MRRALLLVGTVGFLGCNDRDAQNITGVKASSLPIASATIETQSTAYHVVFSSPSLSAPIPAATAAFGPSLLDTPDAVIDANLVAAVDPAETIGGSTLDACSPLTNAAAVAGRIALVQRGTCTFALKVLNAQTAGAIAVVIYDNVLNAPLARMAGVPGIDESITIPSIRISRTSGLALVAALATGPVSGRIFLESGDAPTVSVPSDLISETANLAGIAVTFDVSGTTYLGPAAPSCTPASGFVFPQGVTTVTCTVTDIAGNSAIQSFTVTVRLPDTEPPVLMLPNPITAEATGPSGAVVSFVFHPTDNVGIESFGCSNPSPSTFGLGVTSVSCTATDAAGNTATGSFTITVRDTQAPILALPASMLVDATTPAGATVAYAVSAMDLVSGSVAVTCSPSGSSFPIGVTMVACTASDAFGNAAGGSFTVSVKAPAAQVNDLQQSVLSYGLPSGTESILSSKVSAASQALASGNTMVACGNLGALINKVSAQSGKNIPIDTANEIIADARRIMAASGC
jgi:hypothetical protein